jgi:ketosteroid isomerase-like protein
MPSPSILSLSADMQHAANAHDTDRFMAPFVHQPSLVFAIDGEVIHGWDALHAQQLKWWRNGKSDVVYTPTGDIQIMSLASNLAVSTQTLSSRRTLPNGKTSTGTFVVSYIWKKLPQGWQIVYGHESWSREDAGTKSK